MTTVAPAQDDATNSDPDRWHGGDAEAWTAGDDKLAWLQRGGERAKAVADGRRAAMASTMAAGGSEAPPIINGQICDGYLLQSSQPLAFNDFFQHYGNNRNFNSYKRGPNPSIKTSSHHRIEQKGLLARGRRKVSWAQFGLRRAKSGQSFPGGPGYPGSPIGPGGQLSR
ncbi:hypothetical protein ACLOJK_018914, partial [Asimina triloba]